LTKIYQKTTKTASRSRNIRANAATTQQRNISHNMNFFLGITGCVSVRFAGRQRLIAFLHQGSCFLKNSVFALLQCRWRRG